jgi:hypothetical protein
MTERTYTKSVDGRDIKAYLNERDIDLARQIGEGNISKGIRLALAAHAANSSPQPEDAGTTHQLPERDEVVTIGISLPFKYFRQLARIGNGDVNRGVSTAMLTHMSLRHLCKDVGILPADANP